MNAFFASTVVKTILKLKRTCLKCKKDQVVSLKQKEEMIKCKYCGADISPKK